MPVEATIVSIATMTGVITATAHGFVTGNVVGWFPSPVATLPDATPAISLNTPYIVRRIDNDTLTLHLTLAGANANTGAVAFTDEGDGTLDLVQISVRERIERQLLATVAAVDGVDVASRFDMRGNRNPPATDGTPTVYVLILPEDESATDGPSGFSTRTLAVTVETLIVIAVDEAMPTPAVVNRILAKLDAGLMASPHIPETATGYGLAVDSKITGAADYDIQDGQPELTVSIDLEIQFRHLRDDPASLA
jgi:hypothetical protein